MRIDAPVVGDIGSCVSAMLKDMTSWPKPPAEWLNAVAAHASCNERKGNRTPAEANMPLLWQPWVPTRAELVIDN